MGAADLSSLTLVQYGGSPVQERVARAWLDRGVRLLQGYGMTEASPGVYMGTHDGTVAHPTAVGVPHFFTDVALLRDDRAEPVGGEPAELVVRGPHVFAGYWNRPEETAATFVDGRWFRTGDVLRSTTTAGRTWSTGSRTCTSPAGRTCTPPRWRPSRRSSTPWPTAPSSAWPTPGGARSASPTCSCARAPRSSEAELRAHLEAHLARYKIPKYLEFVPELPRNATGKIRRVELRHRAADEHPTADNQVAASPRPEGAS